MWTAGVLWLGYLLGGIGLPRVPPVRHVGIGLLILPPLGDVGIGLPKVRGVGVCLEVMWGFL
jgi:hypothetical protein